MKQMSFSQIDKAVKEFNIAEAGVANPEAAEKENAELVIEPFEEERKIVISEKFLKVYNVVRPILFMVSNFPFFPAKWRAVVNVFINALDDLIADPNEA
jgi:hypothetical protein